MLWIWSPDLSQKKGVCDSLMLEFYQMMLKNAQAWSVSSPPLLNPCCVQNQKVACLGLCLSKGDMKTANSTGTKLSSNSE